MNWIVIKENSQMNLEKTMIINKRFQTVIHLYV